MTLSSIGAQSHSISVGEEQNASSESTSGTRQVPTNTQPLPNVPQGLTDFVNTPPPAPVAQSVKTREQIVDELVSLGEKKIDVLKQAKFSLPDKSAVDFARHFESYSEKAIDKDYHLERKDIPNDISSKTTISVSYQLHSSSAPSDYRSDMDRDFYNVGIHPDGEILNQINTHKKNEDFKSDGKPFGLSEIFHLLTKKLVPAENIGNLKYFYVHMPSGPSFGQVKAIARELKRELKKDTITPEDEKFFKASLALPNLQSALYLIADHGKELGISGVAAIKFSPSGDILVTYDKTPPRN